MPFIEKIIEQINTSLKGSSLKEKRFQTGKFLGVSTVAARNNGGKLEMLPAVVDLNGEYKLVEPDDRHSVILYHKVISNVYAASVQNSYGCEYAFKSTTEVAMVVIADGKKMKMSAEQLEPLFIYGIPQRVTQKYGMINILITPLASNMDKVAVFRQEYPNNEYFLKPYQHLFLIRYRVECTFDKNCIDKCLCGE
jgi:hypothetical protein